MNSYDVSKDETRQPSDRSRTAMEEGKGKADRNAEEEKKEREIEGVIRIRGAKDVCTCAR